MPEPLAVVALSVFVDGVSVTSLTFAELRYVTRYLRCTPGFAARSSQASSAEAERGSRHTCRAHCATTPPPSVRCGERLASCRS